MHENTTGRFVRNGVLEIDEQLQNQEGISACTF